MVSAISFDFKNYPLLNLGGGDFEQREFGWLNLDYPFEATAGKRDFANIDIVYNMMSGEPIPIPDHSLSAVYSEHAIEHLTLNAATFIFSEVNRILRPGGVFRISVPDADRCWKTLIDPDAINEEYPSVWRSKYSDNSKEQSFLDAVCSPLRGVVSNEELRTIIAGKSLDAAMEDLYLRLPDIDIGKQARRPGAHISWWNYDRLCFYLDKAGFSEINGPLERRTSAYKAFRRDFIDRTAYKWSVRVEAKKL